MAEFKVFRETTLPGTLQAYSVYFVAPASAPDYVEIYVTGATGSIVRRVVKESDIQSMIDAALTGYNTLQVVADLAERDALTLLANSIVLVLDASDDPTVTSSSATYVYRASDTSWTKISESESMDVVLSWANITGKPTSSVADIDDAVSKRHAHTNLTQLEKIGEDANGKLTYNGSLPVIAWETTSW